MRRNNVRNWFISIILSVLAIFAFLLFQQNKPYKLDDFARCLKDKGAVFYGAFWCPHCQNQKSLFGRSKRLLPYVECSTADGKGQTSTCVQKAIQNYPTWEFVDGSRLTGEISLQQLSEKTSCSLPE